MTKLNSHNEWDKLREVIVGTAKKSSPVITWRKNNKLDKKQLELAKKITEKANPKWYMDEIEEDLYDLSITIEDFGAKVFRPKPYDCSNFFFFTQLD